MLLCNVMRVITNFASIFGQGVLFTLVAEHHRARHQISQSASLADLGRFAAVPSMGVERV